MMSKPTLNELRQVKDIVYSPQSNADKVNHAEIGKKVLELRKKYSNNQEFGNAIERYLLNKEDYPTFPGIQNL